MRLAASSQFDPQIPAQQSPQQQLAQPDRGRQVQGPYPQKPGGGVRLSPNRKLPNAADSARRAHAGKTDEASLKISITADNQEPGE